MFRVKRFVINILTFPETTKYYPQFQLNLFNWSQSVFFYRAKVTPKYKTAYRNSAEVIEFRNVRFAGNVAPHGEQQVH